MAKIAALQEARLFEWQARHAEQTRDWQTRRTAYDRQLQWYAVSLPVDVDRVDLAGGTLSGWSALLTMIAAPRLSAGGDVTVLDLTEGAVAGDLLAVARRSGIDPLVWVLPGDLPRLDLGTGLDADALADVLAGDRRRRRAGWGAERPGPGPPRSTTRSCTGSSVCSALRRASPRSRPRCGCWPRSATRASTCRPGC